MNVYMYLFRTNSDMRSKNKTTQSPYKKPRHRFFTFSNGGFVLTRPTTAAAVCVCSARVLPAGSPPGRPKLGPKGRTWPALRFDWACHVFLLQNETCI